MSSPVLYVYAARMPGGSAALQHCIDCYGLLCILHDRTWWYNSHACWPCCLHSCIHYLGLLWPRLAWPGMLCMHRACMPAGCATLQHLIYRICGLLCTLLDRGCAYVCIHARMHASCAALQHCMGSPSLLWPCWQEMQHIYMALCLMAVLPCSTVQDSHSLL